MADSRSLGIGFCRELKTLLLFSCGLLRPHSIIGFGYEGVRNFLQSNRRRSSGLSIQLKSVSAISLCIPWLGGQWLLASESCGVPRWRPSLLFRGWWSARGGFWHHLRQPSFWLMALNGWWNAALGILLFSRRNTKFPPPRTYRTSWLAKLISSPWSDGAPRPWY